MAALLCAPLGLIAGCATEPEAKGVHRADLVGHWHAGESCDTSLALGSKGSARYEHWATDYSVSQSRITKTVTGRGSWSLDTFGSRQVLRVETGEGGEELTLLRPDDGRLLLLQIPGDDPDNSIGCRFRQVDEK
ncbi:MULTISPECIES: hypothetical protein [unclassified Streptomyces]|uniref:hypothetical protein n=1 Tax=unclassified Streptomyces TaxID=2593676 RepID=UPI000DC242E5|nr:MULTISPECIES: hypothetical protein [unclassified Streptomyces]MYT72465.1 hypothetical protein [Streptomyces sp. SID8367]RAJ70611.1 hypothetical protein K377_07893 [Streptomyces sp. PsTaAH-137]